MTTSTDRSKMMRIDRQMTRASRLTGWITSLALALVLIAASAAPARAHVHVFIGGVFGIPLLPYPYGYGYVTPPPPAYVAVPTRPDCWHGREIVRHRAWGRPAHVWVGPRAW